VLPWGRPHPLLALAVSLALVPALAGCILTADKLDPALDVPDKYTRAKGDAQTALPPLAWWRGFRSAELTDLMEQAQTANLDIAAAIARIVQADALARQAGAALLPNITGSASDTRARVGQYRHQRDRGDRPDPLQHVVERELRARFLGAQSRPATRRPG